MLVSDHYVTLITLTVWPMFRFAGAAGMSMMGGHWHMPGYLMMVVHREAGFATALHGPEAVSLGG